MPVSYTHLDVYKRQELQNYVKRGRNAVSVGDVMQISKKFVSTRGWQAFATLTVVATVNTDSMPQLSASSRSSSMMTLPVMLMFCVPKIGVPIHRCV